MCVCERERGWRTATAVGDYFFDFVLATERVLHESEAWEGSETEEVDVDEELSVAARVYDEKGVGSWPVVNGRRRTGRRGS